jgi:hypothetical protein
VVILIVNSLVPEADRINVFAHRNQVLNATPAAGSLAAGVAIIAPWGDGIPWLLVVNAIGYVPTAWALLNARTDAPADEQAQDEERPDSGRVAHRSRWRCWSRRRWGCRCSSSGHGLLAWRIGNPSPVGSEIWPPTNGGTRL